MLPPARRMPLVLFSFLGCLALLAGGCKQQEDLMQRLDPASRARLDALPAAETVLLSLKGKQALADLPPLGEGGRVLGRSGTSLLLEIPRNTLPALGGVEDVSSATIWGGGSAVGKLDPSLRAQVLQALDAGAALEPLNMIATFRNESDGLKAKVEAAGAMPRTVAGPVVTLDASPEAVMRMLAMPDLVSLNRPRILNPLSRDQ